MIDYGKRHGRNVLLSQQVLGQGVDCEDSPEAERAAGGGGGADDCPTVEDTSKAAEKAQVPTMACVLVLNNQ